MEINLISQNEAEKFEPTAKVLAANGVAQSLSFTTERKYLREIGSNTKPFSLHIASNKLDTPTKVDWIQITQVGKPVDNESEKCFSAIQKILSVCFIPSKIQLIFIVQNIDGKAEMYIGIRSFVESINEEFADGICNFIKGIWPGMNCERKLGDLKDVKEAIKSISTYKYAFTGIPSMQSQYKSIYPATIDNLLAGMRNKDFSYMVIAEPIPETEIDSILYQIRDYGGQAEALKSFNFSENLSEGVSKAISESKSVCDGISNSETKKSPLALVGSGLMLASVIFPPAGAVSTALNALNSLNTIAGADLLAELAPTTTESTNHSETITNSVTNTKSTTKGQAISNNIVNKQIEAVAEHLYYHSQRYEAGKSIGCWSVGVYILADTAPDIKSASMQLKSIVSGQESVYEPIRIHDIQDVIGDGDNFKNTLGSMDCPIIRIKALNETYFKNPLGKHFNDLRTVLTTKELSYYINFPLRSVPGISVVDSSPEFSLNQPVFDNGIAFGSLLYGGSSTTMEYKIPVESLSRHTLLSGINGSGKTNTVQAILNGINDLPFLVIEPAKTEYVDWALEYNEQHPNNPINIYIPGCVNYKGKFKLKSLKLNPFEIVWLDEKQDPNVLTHIDRLKSTFAAAFPMYDILPVLMEDLIYTIYQNKSTDWLNEKPVFGKTIAPTLNSMKVSVDKVIENHQYEERISRNMKACLNTRIDSLLRGWKKDMLNTVKSTPWDELFEKPTIINLSYVGDDVDKGFFMSLILQFLYEYRSALAEANSFNYNDSGCKHLTVIEEAHRVMSKCDKQDLPQYKTAMMFSNMLSEIRAYGEGFLLVDQVPTRLIPDAIKNTNLKITHRLVAEDDCKAIGESMGLNKEQRMVIPKLLTGQCIVSSSLSTDIYWIKTKKVK